VRSGGTGTITRQIPSAMHQNAMAVGSFEPNGSGASATTANSSKEAATRAGRAIIAPWVMFSFALNKGAGSGLGLFALRAAD
jgi:hypothetical protein